MLLCFFLIGAPHSDFATKMEKLGFNFSIFEVALHMKLQDFDQ